MKRYAILLENGHLVMCRAFFHSTARAELDRWRERHFYGVRNDDLAIIRRPVALIHLSKPRNRAAVAMGAAGGKARAAALSPKRRTEIARKAAAARWNAA